MDRIQALEAYVRIVELGSFTAAAEDLRLRQATVSRWIARLEEELQLQLLDRTTRSVRVTEAGQRFYERSRELLSLWSRAVADARQEQQQLMGRLRVSMPVVFGQLYISPQIARFAAEHAQLELELQFNDRYVDLVQEGVDLCLRVGRAIDVEYRARILGSTPRRLVAAPDYLARHGAPAHPDELSQHACLLHSGLNNRQTWVFSVDDREHRVDLRGRFGANHSLTLLEIAKAGQGLALLASWLVDESIEAGDLVEVMVEYPAPVAPVQVLYASRKHTTAAAQAFVEFLEEILAPIFF